MRRAAEKKFTAAELRNAEREARAQTFEKCYDFIRYCIKTRIAITGTEFLKSAEEARAAKEPT